jgi:O-methyltransferase
MNDSRALWHGFPSRHINHARWLMRQYSQPKQWSSVPSIIHSRVVPTATYSPWLSDEAFRSVYERVKDSTMVEVYRCYELWTLAKQAPQGAVLEVGVWRGGTGAILAAATQKTVYLADTFRGVVKAGAHDTRYRGGEHADTSKADVEALLGSLGLSAILLEGIFPEETAQHVDVPISFLHADVDTYDSTKDVVDWTLRRLVPGGVIVFDDYGFSGCEGVTRFVNELRSDPTLLFVHNLNGHAILVKR